MTTERTVTHATFTIERTYKAPLARVWAAWSKPEERTKWFSCHDNGVYELDFRIGGRETYRGGPDGGPTYSNETRYQHIVPNQRIIYTYFMHADDTLISVSVVTVEFQPAGAGTRLIFTEQGTFLDGHDAAAQREHGTAVGLDKLGDVLQSELANA